jgi:hypothetical protein
MKIKILSVLVLPIFLLAIFAGGALAANKSSRYERSASVALPVIGGSQTPAYSVPTPMPPMYEGGKAVNCDQINSQVLIHQIDQWGTTYYDYQKNGSMGRMIAIGPGGYRHMIFHKLYYYPYGTPPTGYPRYVMYNCKDPSNNWLGETAIDGGTNKNAGYAQIAVLHNGVEVAVYHQSTSVAPLYYSVLRVGDGTDYICQGYFSNLYDLPDHIEGTPTGQNGMWPKACVKYDAVKDTDYIHVVLTQNSPNAGDDQILGYERCQFQGTTMKCITRYGGSRVTYTRLPNTNYPGPLDYVGAFDTSKSIAALPVASPVSRKVAVVYMRHRQDTQYNNDVMYFESTNNGDDWLDGTQWPPVKHNVTNYATGSTERAYTDLAACYDYGDTLHIAWTGCFFDSVAGTYNSVKSNLYHWSIGSGKVLVAPGQWEETNPGAWNRSLSKMSISVKDPVYHPGEPPYVFLTWTQFNPGDTSLGGYGNGDIYGAVSNDGGRTWTPGYNLTNTQTPNCATGACLSEHWSSMAENMYNGDEHIEYVCDRDAGGCVQPNEGTWTDNDMMYIHVAQFPWETHCGISYTVVDPPSWTEPPMKIAPAGFRNITLDVLGIYNLGGNYSVVSLNPKVQITSNGSGYLSPGQSKTVGGVVQCSGEDLINAIIRVHGCIGTAEEDSIDLPLYAVCDSNDYYECKRAPNTYTKSNNGICSLWVCVNTSQEVYDLRVRDDHGDPQRSIFSSGVIVATSAGSDKVVGRQEDNFTQTGARDTIYTDDIDPASGNCRIHMVFAHYTYIWFPEVINPVTSDIRWWWLQIQKKIITLQDKPGFTCEEWKKEQVIKQIWVKWSRPPVWWPTPGTYAGHEDIYFGIFADPDAPSDTGCGSCNKPGWDNTRKMMWLHGRYNGQHPEYEGYYVGLTFTDTLGGVVDPYAAKNVRNDVYIYPQSGWRTDSLYQLASIQGLWMQDPDSMKDRSVVMTAAKIPASSDPNDTTFLSEFILIEALINNTTESGGLTQLQTHIDDTRQILIPELHEQWVFSRRWPPYVCGDAYRDGVVDGADIAYLLNYLYSGGPPPVPYQAGDANGDTRVDIADVAALGNYLFLPGYQIYCYGDRPCSDLGERDTLIIQGIWGSAGEIVDVPIYVFNDDSIFFNLSLRIPDPSKAIFLDTLITESTRLAEISVVQIPHDTTGIQIWLSVIGGGYWNGIPPGSGIVAYLRCVLKQDIPFDSPMCIDTTFFPPGHSTGFYTPNTYCIIPEFKCTPPPPRPPYDVKANSDNQGVYLTWENPQAYDVLYLYCQTDTLILLEVLPGTDTSYSYTPATPGVYCYYLKGEKGGAPTGYSEPACASFTTGYFMDQPSAITWTDSSLLQFRVLICYEPGGYTPSSYLPNSYDPGGYHPPIPGECESGFFWDPDDSLCRPECTEGYFWDEDDNLCRENCLEGYFWDEYTDLCWEECDPGFFWDTDDSLCRPNCVSGYDWNNSVNQCCQSGKADEELVEMGTGWHFGNPTYEPGNLYLGWGTNLEDQYYQDNICTPALIGAVVKVPPIQPVGGTRIYVKHWYRTADQNDRLVVLARDRAGGSDVALYPTEDGLGFSGYHSGTGNNSCGNNIPGFAEGPGIFCWSRFDIPIQFNGKTLSLKFILGSDATGHQGPGGTNTGWFINKAIYIGTELHRGDCNCDGAVDASDLVYLLNYLFVNGPKPCVLGEHGSAGDVNCDGDIDAEDLVYILNYLFVNGPPSPCPP